MTISTVLGLLGGLALFLYGMQMMSSGLEAAAGNRMKSILEKLTANRFLGVLVGALITAVIQSSSATTVMVVGFVNAGMMTLPLSGRDARPDKNRLVDHWCGTSWASDNGEAVKTRCLINFRTGKQPRSNSDRRC